ncbi:hypothetical protein MUK42_09992, partial [Musa troglodytarum]
ATDLPEEEEILSSSSFSSGRCRRLGVGRPWSLISSRKAGIGEEAQTKNVYGFMVELSSPSNPLIGILVTELPIPRRRLRHHLRDPLQEPPSPPQPPHSLFSADTGRLHRRYATLPVAADRLLSTVRPWRVRKNLLYITAKEILELFLIQVMKTQSGMAPAGPPTLKRGPDYPLMCISYMRMKGSEAWKAVKSRKRSSAEHKVIDAEPKKYM